MNRFRRRLVVNRHIRILEHGPRTYRVYQRMSAGPWQALYTGPITDEMVRRWGLMRRETIREVLSRVFRRVAQ